MDETIVFRAIDRISPVLDQIGKNLQGLTGQLSRVSASMLQFGRTVIGTVVQGLQTLAATALKVSAVVGGTLTAALVALGRVGVDMNVTLQGATMALTRITGSGDVATRMMADLRKEALSSVQTYKSLIPIQQQLAAVYTQTYGKSGALGRVIPTIRAFGDAGAILVRGDNEAIGRAMAQFRQVASGLMELESLKGIEENLPGSGVLNIVQKAFGTFDTKELKEAGVTGAMVADAIVKGFQERFGGAQAEMAGTLPVILSNMQDAFDALAGTVTERFTPVLSGAMSKLLGQVQALAGNERLIAALAVPFDLVGVAITKAAEALPGFVNWLESVVTKENVIDLLSGVGGAVQTIHQRVMSFVEATTGGATLGNIFETFRKVATDAIRFVLRAWNMFTAGISFLVDNRGEIFGAIGEGFGIVTEAANYLLSVVTAISDKIGGIASIFTKGGGGQGMSRSGMGASEGNFFAKLVQVVVGLVGFGWMAKEGGMMGSVGRGIDAAVALPKPPDLGKRISALGNRVGNLGSRGLAAMEAAGAGDPLADLDRQFQANKAGIRRTLNGALAGGSMIAGTNGMPPAHQMGGGGLAAVAQRIQMSAKDRAEALKNTNALLDAERAAVEARIEALPDQEQAQARVQQLIPQLVRQMKTLEQMAGLTKRGTDDFFKLETEYWKTWGKIGDIRNDATKAAEQAQKEAADKAKKALEEAVKGAEEASATIMAGFDLEEAGIKASPFLSSQEKRMALVETLGAKFRDLNRPVFGETERDRLRRLTEAENVSGEIPKLLGIGTRSFATLGGGMLDFTDPRAEILDERMGALRMQGEQMPILPGSGGNNVLNFAPQINAAPDAEGLRQTLLRLVDEVVRSAFPEPSGF